MRHYVKLICESLDVLIEAPLLATSVNNNSMVSSVGQEVGEEVTFTEESFANNNWESGE